MLMRIHQYFLFLLNVIVLIVCLFISIIYAINKVLTKWIECCSDDGFINFFSKATNINKFLILNHYSYYDTDKIHRNATFFLQSTEKLVELMNKVVFWIRQTPNTCEASNVGKQNGDSAEKYLFTFCQAKEEVFTITKKYTLNSMLIALWLLEVVICKAFIWSFWSKLFVIAVFN